MPDAKPPYPLSATSAKTILEAARPAVTPSPEMIEATRRWLEESLENAVCRVRAKPLSQKDVYRLDRAYLRFRYVIQDLQDRQYPPPLIPTKECQTDWDYWLTTHRAIQSKLGPSYKVDWQLIGELIALYEVTSKRNASGSKAGGPTMHFLDAALKELQNYVPVKERSYFQAPGIGVLRENLDNLHKGYFRFLREELNSLIENRGR